MWWAQLGGGREPRHALPLREALAAEVAVLLGGEEMAAGAEEGVHGAERFEKALGVLR